jgi:hypothetical protein
LETGKSLEKLLKLKKKLKKSYDCFIQNKYT